MPIGITAAGDVVFPFECKEFLEKYKADMDKSATVGGAPTRPNSTTEVQAPEAAPAVSKAATPAPKDATDQSSNNGAAAVANAPAAPKGKTAGEKPKPERKLADTDSAATAPRDGAAGKRKHEHEHEKGSPACMQFRSYDSGAGTYRGYDGEVHPCPPK